MKINQESSMAFADAYCNLSRDRCEVLCKSDAGFLQATGYSWTIDKLSFWKKVTLQVTKKILWSHSKYFPATILNICYNISTKRSYALSYALECIIRFLNTVQNIYLWYLLHEGKTQIFTFSENQKSKIPPHAIIN